MKSTFKDYINKENFFKKKLIFFSKVNKDKLRESILYEMKRINTRKSFKD